MGRSLCIYRGNISHIYVCVCIDVQMNRCMYAVRLRLRERERGDFVFRFLFFVFCFVGLFGEKERERKKEKKRNKRRKRAESGKRKFGTPRRFCVLWFLVYLLSLASSRPSSAALNFLSFFSSTRSSPTHRLVLGPHALVILNAWPCTFAQLLANTK